MDDEYTVDVTEDGVTFTQHVGGLWSRTSSLNLAARYAALAASMTDPPLVMWISDDDDDNRWFGYDAAGHLVAAAWQTRCGGYAATLGQRQVTSDRGTVDLAGAQAIVELNARTEGA